MHACMLRHLSSVRLWSNGLGPTRLLCPWDFLCKNTGISCHALLQGNLPNPGIKFMPPALAGGFFTASATWEAHIEQYYPHNPCLIKDEMSFLKVSVEVDKTYLYSYMIYSHNVVCSYVFLDRSNFNNIPQFSTRIKPLVVWCKLWIYC